MASLDGCIQQAHIDGKGIGWIDTHLLLSCILNSTELWTADKTLLSVARFCGAKLYS